MRDKSAKPEGFGAEGESPEPQGFEAEGALGIPFT
jgi:hypothetical protein